MAIRQYPANPEVFWKIRSAKYTKVYWTKDEPCLDRIRKAASFKRSDVVLDVGTSLRAFVSRAAKNFLGHTLDPYHSVGAGGLGVSTVVSLIMNAIRVLADVDRMTSRGALE